MESVRIEKWDYSKPTFAVYYSGGMGNPRLTEEEEKKVAEIFEIIVAKYRERDTE